MDGCWFVSKLCWYFPLKWEDSMRIIADMFGWSGPPQRCRLHWMVTRGKNNMLSWPVREEFSALRGIELAQSKERSPRTQEAASGREWRWCTTTLSWCVQAKGEAVRRRWDTQRNKAKNLPHLVEFQTLNFSEGENIGEWKRSSWETCRWDYLTRLRLDEHFLWGIWTHNWFCLWMQKPLISQLEG